MWRALRPAIGARSAATRKSNWLPCKPGTPASIVIPWLLAQEGSKADQATALPASRLSCKKARRFMRPPVIESVRGLGQRDAE
jgi:hypothetical protein